eukprot:TRINITY_DN1994_c0_g1_i1.p1 TRINITY_DN1994_c0_g1~~TRINITY_DN1994_c0_g1_i1.p1  ORF type:complete len:649 (+),score=191.02 TRINITY_DN1994_c0_g1_i1:136-2082(+)
MSKESNPKVEPHNTRSRSLKRDLAAVEDDEDKVKARSILEPVLKRARTTLVTTSVSHPTVDDDDSEGEGDDGRGEGETIDGRSAADLSMEARAEIEMVFNLFDENKDGHISVDELGAVLRNLGFRPTVRQVGAIMREGDEDGNGTLELDEFVRMMARLRKLSKAEAEEEEQRAKEEAERKAKKKADRAKQGLAEKSKKKETSKKKAASSSTSSTTSTSTTTTTPKKKPAPPKPKAVTPSRASTATSTTQSTPVPASTGLRRQLKRGDSVLQLRRTQNILKLNRGLSISDFYTLNAGKNTLADSTHERDAFNNPVGREFDLGREGAFGRFGVYVGLFCLELTEKVFMEGPGIALQQKGFRVICTNDEAEFAEHLRDYDVGFVVSSDLVTLNTARVAQACLEFHQGGGGLAIWADNQPFFATANAILAKICPGMNLTGDTPGDNDLKLGLATKPGCFKAHLLTSGIETLYEGVTICYPSNTKDLTVLATSTDKHPCMLCADYDILNDAQGRFAIDTGFTKLGYKWDSAGTGRYVRNMSVWLLGLEHRLRIGAPLQGKIDLEAINKAKQASEGESDVSPPTTTTTTTTSTPTTHNTEETGESEGKGKERAVGGGDNKEEEEDNNSNNDSNKAKNENKEDEEEDEPRPKSKV